MRQNDSQPLRSLLLTSTASWCQIQYIPSFLFSFSFNMNCCFLTVASTKQSPWPVNNGRSLPAALSRIKVAACSRERKAASPDGWDPRCRPCQDLPSLRLSSPLVGWPDSGRAAGAWLGCSPQLSGHTAHSATSPISKSKWHWCTTGFVSVFFGLIFHTAHCC